MRDGFHCLHFEMLGGQILIELFQVKHWMKTAILLENDKKVGKEAGCVGRLDGLDGSSVEKRA